MSSDGRELQCVQTRAIVAVMCMLAVVGACARNQAVIADAGADAEPLPATPERLTWRVDQPLRAAISEAAGRNLLLSVVEPACAECEAMATASIKSTQLRKLMNDCLLLRYDATQGEGKDVAERYNVVSVPTIILINGRGRELERLTGFESAGSFIDRMTLLLSSESTLAVLKQQAEEFPADTAIQLELGRQYALRGRADAARDALNRVMKDEARAGQAMLFEGETLLLKSLNDPVAAREKLRALMKRFPQSAAARQAVVPLSVALFRSGDANGAGKMLEMWAKTPEMRQRAAEMALNEAPQDRTAMLWAEKQAVMAAEAVPPTADRWATVARIRQKLRKHQQAEINWSQALALDPKNQAYRTQRDIAVRVNGSGE